MTKNTKSRRDVFVNYRSGSLDEIQEALIQKTEGPGLVKKARTLILAAVEPMVWARDHSRFRVGLNVLLSLISLEGLIGLVNRTTVGTSDLPDDVLKGVKSYLESLTGYNEASGVKQSKETVDHHHVIEVRAQEVLSSKLNSNRKGFPKHGKKSVSNDNKKAVLPPRTTRVDRVNGYAIEKTTDSQSTVYTVLHGDDKSPFDALGKARDFAKSLAA